MAFRVTALNAATFSGHRPTGSGDLTVETHGIAPLTADQRYGHPARLFTVWFAPQVNMTGVFTGTLAIALGLGFWLGLLAMLIGTVLGSAVVAYLSTWGPRTGAGQLPNARMAFGDLVVVPGILQWGSSIAWDALVGLFGGEALAALLGIPFWSAVLIVLAVQGVVGFFGYELIHRLQAVLTVILFITFAVFTVKLVSGHDIVVAPSAAGADLAGAFVFEVTIALSLAISWASYAADFSRYLPSDSSRWQVFGYSFAGIASAFVPVRFYDYRPPELVLENLHVGAADLCRLPFPDRSIASLSCMHVVEHVGLGRYGDPLDPDGDLKAAAELQRVLAPGGSLLIVVPVGRERVCFNAHRVYAVDSVLRPFPELTLKQFALVPQDPGSGGLVLDPPPALVGREDYGCGCFWLERAA